jgi:anti-sigma B factor antagonist
VTSRPIRRVTVEPGRRTWRRAAHVDHEDGRARSDGRTRPSIAVRGEIDPSSVDKVRAAIDRALAASPEIVLLDLSRIAFCDSSGLRMVVGSHRRARAHGGRLVVVRPVGPAWRTFEICRIDLEVEFVDAGTSDPALGRIAPVVA